MPSVLRTSLLLAPLVLLSRGAAFAVPVLLARWYGIDPSMDAFYYAVGVPTFILIVATSGLATVLVPLLSTHPETPLGSLSFRVGATITLIGLLQAPLLSALLPTISNFDAHTQTEVIRCIWWLIPFMGVESASIVLRTACELRQRFSIGASGPLLRASVMIVAAWLMGSARMLPIALLGGATLELLWFAAFLPIRFGPLPPSLRSGLKALGPVILGEGLVALNLLVDRVFAGMLAEGSVTTLEYADKVHLIPQTLFESTLVVVAFNRWANLPTPERPAAIRLALRQVLLLVPPILAGFSIGATALVRLLFEHGAFDPQYTPATAATIIAFIPGVFTALLGALFMKAHALDGRFHLVGWLGLLSAISNALLNALLGDWLGVPGLAWSTTLSSILIVLISGALLPALKGGYWRDALPFAAITALLCLALTGLQPADITTPLLWICAIPFVVLLIIGAKRLRA